MKPTIGKKYLITTDNWFIAPDGESYRSAFGTIKGIMSDEQTLGIKTNRGSTNWYVQIGCMLIAGCQIHYAVETPEVSFTPPTRELDHEGVIRPNQSLMSAIYDADSQMNKEL